MTTKEAWNAIIAGLTVSPGDFSTVPQIKREPLWFYARTNGNYILIDKARQARPSCQISVPRKIIYSDFAIVYPYYNKWVLGETGVRSEVRQKSRNTAYIFALIKRFCI